MTPPTDHAPHAAARAADGGAGTVALAVRGLRKSYGDAVAVDGVSFEVRRGETFGFLGPNGAGKTTTILLLVGALRPDAGEIEIDGAKDPTRPDVRRGIGIAPQAIALYDALTARENLAFFGSVHGLAGAALEARIAHGLEFAGLADRGGHRVETFSGGMKRRLNIACALVHDPQVLLLDEPTAGVDPQSRLHLMERIERLRDAGRTVLYTTHAMEEAQRLCDRVAILDHGKVLAEGTVPDLVARHGGMSSIEAEFERPPADAAALGGVAEGSRVRIDAERPLEVAARLASCGTPLVSLEIRKPSLETVFLALTGRRLRDG